MLVGEIGGSHRPGKVGQSGRSRGTYLGMKSGLGSSARESVRGLQARQNLKGNNTWGIASMPLYEIRLCFPSHAFSS